MESSRLADWLQIVALVGVIAGLIAVVYELRQNRDIARTEHLREISDLWMQVGALEIDSEIGGIVIRAVEDPESLTPQEVFKFETWLMLHLQIFVYQEGAIEENIGLDIGILDESWAKYYFASSHAREWFSKWGSGLRNETRTVIERVISTTPIATSWPPYSQETTAE